MIRGEKREGKKKVPESDFSSDGEKKRKKRGNGGEHEEDN